MKHKYKIIRAFVYERKALENYINDMANQGWHIDKLGLNHIRFVQDHKKQVYSVVFVPKATQEDLIYETDEQKNLKSFMNDFNFEFVCSNGMFQVYTSQTKEDIYTDEEVEFDYISKSKIKYGNLSPYWWGVLWLFFIVLTMIYSFSTDEIIRLLSDYSKWITYPVSILGLIISIYEIILLKKYKRDHVLESNPKVFKFRFVLLILVIVFCMIITFNANLEIVVGLLFWAIFSLLSKKEKIREQNGVVFLLLGACVLISMILVPTVSMHDFKQRDDALLNELGLKYKRYYQASSVFASYEGFTLEQDLDITGKVVDNWVFTGLLEHYTLKDSFLKPWIQEELEHKFIANEIHYSNQDNCYYVNQDEDYYLIPIVESDEAYRIIEEHLCQ